MPKTTTRDTTSTRTKGRPGRRQIAKPRRDLPMMPLAVGGLFLLILIGMVIWYRAVSTTSISGQPVAGIQCDSGEQLAVHYHAHVDILYNGQPVSVPGQIGIPGNCFYWLHTHDTTGIIHIEAPSNYSSRHFTLGDFFSVWGQPLSTSKVGTINVPKGETLKIWVNGTPYTGDPSKIVLTNHEQIVLEIGPPYSDPPPTFTWPSGY